MPRINLARIKSAPKNTPVLFWGSLVLIVLAIGLIGWMIVTDMRTAEAPVTAGRDGKVERSESRPAEKLALPENKPAGTAVQEQVRTTVGDKPYTLETAVGLQEQQRGLGGRSGLKPGTGMLFEAAQEEEFCMWMKDMQFAIDIIWLSSEKKVVQIERNVQPETYPKDFCAHAQYVIELPAGAAAENGIKIGQTVEL